MFEDVGKAGEARAWALRRRRFRLVAVSTLLLVVVIFAAISARDYFTVGVVQLPDVVGMAYPDAARVLRQAGLTPNAFIEDVPEAALNAVTTQSPAAGSGVRQGRIIHVGVNSPPAATQVPPLVGLTEAQALQRTTELELHVTALDYRIDAKPLGTVIAQAPEPGTVLGPNARLALTVSGGPERQPLEVPDVSGMPYAAAVDKLKAMGFSEVEALPGGVSFDKVGAVTSQNPAAGTKVPPGTPLAVFYALSGRTIVQVPDVNGLPLWRAQLALEAAQLVTGHVSYVQQKDAPQGVVKVEPSSYTLPGTPVQITVNGTPSANPLPPSGGGGVGGLGTGGFDGGATAGGTRTVPFTFDPASMGLKRLVDNAYQLKLVVRDADGERTLLDRTMKAGESVSMTVQVHGSSPLLQTYIDGVFFQAWRP